ncbi:MAG: cysteine--tRNA ligase [Phycisphaerae bacterium]
MSIRVYNTLTQKKEPFETLEPGKVGIYLCGPTVYKPSHIGHAVGPIIFDVIKRYLVHKGYDVKLVVNITDVDDKLIEEAEAQNTTVPALAERITHSYLDSMARLGIDTFDEMPKASEHIGDIVRLIQGLIANDAAYVSGADVYFDVTHDDDYGKLSNRKQDDQTAQRDVAGEQKRNPGDFALWKGCKPHEPAEVRYASPWGEGRPGWHIECSAMSMRYLGESFDIHGGGMDLIFPHHENEIAQAECATGKTFAKYWFHHGLTRFNTKKVSKSDAAMQDAMKKMTLATLIDTYGGELLRYFVISTHYRRPIEFSDAEIESKRKGLSNFHRLFERVERLAGRTPYVDPRDKTDHWAAAPKAAFEAFAHDVDRCVEQFFAAMDDDFNTAAATAACYEFCTRINRFVEEQKLETADDDDANETAYAAARRLMDLGRLQGLFMAPPQSKTAGDATVDKLMTVLIDARSRAKKAKQFDIADAIRNGLTDAGITLEDRPDGTQWRID